MARKKSPPPTTVPIESFFAGDATYSFYAVQCPGKDDSTAEASIKQDCLAALNALHGGLLKKSTKIMKKAIARHPRSATLHRTLAFMHLMSAVRNSNSPTKVNFLKEAVEAAKKSLDISPNQISLILLHNQMLFDLAKDREDFERIVNQCQQALSIQDPIDPKNSIIVKPKDKLTEGVATKESRVEDVKGELQRLRQKANRLLLGSDESKEEESKMFEPADELLQPFINARKRQESIRKELDLEIQMVRDKQALLYLGSCQGVDNDRRSKKSKAPQFVAKSDRKALVLDYWRSMSGEGKRRFLEMNVDEVMRYYSTNESAMSVFKEAIGFGKMFQDWKYWDCSSSGCKEWFLDHDFWIDHVVTEHMVHLSQKEKEMLPRPIDDACTYKIKNGAWRPVDVNEMLKIIVARESDDKLKDKKIYADEDNWPFCEDAEREDLLRNIKRLLNLLLRNKCLSEKIVRSLTAFTKFFSSVRKFWHLTPDLNKNALSICLLGSQQLSTIYGWLDEMSHCCELVETPEGRIPSDEVYIDQQYEERISFTNEFLHLSLDERVLGGESDDFVHWLYDGDEIGRLAESWAGLRVYKMEKAEEVLRYLDSEFIYLQKLCREKCFLMRYVKAFLAIRGMCTAEDRKKKEIPGYIPQNCMHQLFNLRDELAGSKEGDGVFQCHAVFDILKTVELYCQMKFGSQDALISANTQLSDLKAVDDDDEQSRIENQLAAAEAFVRNSLDVKIFDVVKQECKVEALMMKSLAVMDLDRMLGLLSAHDYLPIMLHLLKSFVRSHLEKFALKDAEKRAETVEKELMSEIACHQDKNMDKGHEKNKKRKDNRNTKQKTTSSGRQEHQSLTKKNKEIRFCTISSGHNPDLAITDGLVNWEEGASPRQMSYDEMIELEKHLEYQRKFEDEAKKKRLLDKNKKMSEIRLLNVEDQLLKLPSESEGKDIEDVKEQQRQIERKFEDEAKQKQLWEKNKKVSETPPLLSEHEGMDTKEHRKEQRQIKNNIEQKRLAEKNKQTSETSAKNVENDTPLVSKPPDAAKYNMSGAHQNSQAEKSIHMDVPFVSKTSWSNRSNVHDKQPGDSSMTISIGSIDCRIPLPTEAYSEHNATIVPTKHKQVEKSGPTTLPGTGHVDVGDSLSQVRNVGLDDTGNVRREADNVPDLEVGVHDHDLDTFNDPYMLTMDQVQSYCRFLKRTNIKRYKECKSCVSEDQGYSSA